MKILYDNKLDNYSLSSTTYTSLYAVNNIFDKQLDRIWKGDATNTTQRIIIDCATPATHTYLAILNHNFTGSQTVTIEANGSNYWASPSYSQVLTIATIIHQIISASAYRYWSIKITGCDITNPPSIGYVFLGDGLDFQEPEKVYPITWRNNCVCTQSDNGSIFGYKSGRKLREYKLVWSWLETSSIEDFETLFDEVEKVIPFVTIWDETEYSIIPNCYCVFTSDPQNDNLHDYSNASLIISIKECR